MKRRGMTEDVPACREKELTIDKLLIVNCQFLWHYLPWYQ